MKNQGFLEAPTNNGYSQDNERLKVLIGIDTGDFRSHEDVIGHLASTMGRTVSLGLEVLNSARRLQTRDGTVIGVEFDRESYSRSITQIVRGLYFNERGRALGLQQVITSWNSKGRPLCLELSLRNNTLRELNDNTFNYSFEFFDDGSSMWRIVFFDSHEVFAFASKPVRSALVVTDGPAT